MAVGGRLFFALSDPHQGVRTVEQRSLLRPTQLFFRTCRSLVNSCTAKIKQHRGADLPVIVAIAFNDFLTRPDEFDMGEVLLGTSIWNVSTGNLQEAEYGRKVDGLWTEERRTARSNCAAVIDCDHCSVTSPVPTRAVCWSNPHVSLPGFDRRWPFARRWFDLPHDPALKSSAGLPTGAAFG